MNHHPRDYGFSFWRIAVSVSIRISANTETRLHVPSAQRTSYRSTIGKMSENFFSFLLSSDCVLLNMLRIQQQTSAGGAKSYYTEAAESRADYYSRDELTGQWHGKGSERLGLTGEVSREAFHSLCDNLDPNTGQSLTQRTREGRTVLYDFNFHAPKSLSVLYTLTKDERLLKVFRAAVRETMAEIESEVKTRVRKGGINSERVTGNLIYAEFIHLTTRPIDGVEDCHLHAHCTTFNATFDSEEQCWKAGQFRDLIRDAPYYESIFHAKLSKAVADLGFGVDRTSKGWEVAGFAKETLNKFSRRTALIEELANEKGIKSNAEKDKLGKKTRERKREARSFDELRSEWMKRLNPSEQRTLAEVAEGKVSTLDAPASSDACLDFAFQHGFERSSVRPERRLLADALKRGYGSVAVEDVKSNLAGRGEVIKANYGDQVFLTTKEILSEEAGMIAFAREGRGTCSPLSDVPLARRKTLNAQQQAAVDHIVGSNDRVMLLRGAAGTGKTTLLRSTAEAAGECGKEIHMFAPTTEAARSVLRRDGFKDADTVARLIADKEIQGRLKNQFIVVDEAGLLGTSDMRQVFRIAEEQNARVLLVGDDRQHSSVPRGTAFKLLQTHAGVPIAEVKEIQRQRGEYKLAVESFSRGETAEGLHRLDRMGCVKEVPGDLRHARLADDYFASTKANKTTLIVAPTHAEGRTVTIAVRDRLKAEGLVVEEKERGFKQYLSRGLTEAQRTDPVSYQKGDMVQFHTRSRGGIRKGDRFEVEGRDEKGNVVVKGRQGDQVILPLAHAKQFDVYEARELSVAPERGSE